MAKVAESFGEFKWPWEKGEVDEEKVAKLIWNARRAEEAAEEKAKLSADKVTDLQAKLDAAEAAKSGTDEEGQQKIKDLSAKVRDLEASNTTLSTEKAKLESEGRPQDKLENARMSVALELGLSLRDAKRLVGENRDELLEDAKAFAEEHGLELNEGDDDTDDEGGNSNSGKPPVREPALNLRTGAGAGRVKVASNPTEAAKSLPPLW